MIRHCVFIRFKPIVSATRKAELLGEIKALKSHLHGLVAVHVGMNVSPEEGMDKGFSDGFIVDFTDSSARDAYLEHPEHRRVGGRLVEAAEGGDAGIFVYDIEITS